MKQNVFKKLNNNIRKLSQTTLIIILALYAALLGGIYALVSSTKTYLVMPEYEHTYWNEYVNPQVTLIGRRTFDDDDNMTLKYSLNVSVYGRISSTSTTDPGYALKDFKMSAATTSSVTSKNPDNMYYFTEYTTYTTPTTHYYTLDNSSANQHPLTLYTMIQYKKAGNSAIATYKEDIFLYPESQDIAKVDEYFSTTGASDAVSRNIKGSDGSQIANIQFIATSQEEYYSTGVKITMQNLGYSYKHHIDMQSWILTTDGKYLPFIGVYSYTQQKTNFSQSGISVYKKLNPEYIVSKLRYYTSETEYTDYYFKQAFDKLPSSFQSTPSVADETIEDEVSNKVAIKIAIICAICIVIIALIITSVLLYKKKESKKNLQIKDKEENKTENIENDQK